MSTTELEPPCSYVILVNDQQQYSIWPLDKQTPPGWCRTPYVGSKTECLDQVTAVWLDMRPLSLRRQASDPALAG